MFRIPKQNLHIFGEPHVGEIAQEEIRILVWNLFKGKKITSFKEDFYKISQKKDFLLLQEAMLDHRMPEFFRGHPDPMHWKQGFSFEYLNGNKTGILTASRSRGQDIELVRSEVRELGFWTPKSTLVSRYSIAQSTERLLVVNTHAINFTWLPSFKSFLLQLEPFFKEHRGPILFAGDFNTWNGSRWEHLCDFVQNYGLKEFHFAEDPRRLKLDHIFIRGLQIKEAKILNWIKSSDHYPLEIIIKIDIPR